MIRQSWIIKNLKPSPFSVAARLPEVYTNFLKELKKEPAPVHYIPEPGQFKKDPVSGMRQRVENVPIPLKFPKQADKGIWGGEGVVQGFLKVSKRRRRSPRFWIPVLKRSIVYSEILNKYISVTVTERTLQLIDKHYGFDNYILETPVQDLKSQLALDLRRTMLLALIDRERHYDDMSQQEKIWEKYKKFEIPREEAEWFGLSMREAIKKQKLIEEEQMKPLPMKLHYRKVYFEQLKEKVDLASEEKSKSWLSKIPLLDQFRKEKDSS